MSSWKSVVGSLAGVIVLGTVVFLLYVIVKSQIIRNAPCKNRTTCQAYQTCDTGRGQCVSLPGSKCTVNSQCSIYAPICQPQGHYCTNISSQARGTSGNPPRDGAGTRCDAGLVLNTVVNVCQQTSIGAQCTIDAQCNLGVCDSQTRTCQYATNHCTTDSTLNPQQCSPPYVCDSGSLTCTISGTTPGGEGTPCNTNSDCAVGSSCISGPPGGGFMGVCRAGHTTWLQLLGEGPNTGTDCMTPLVGGSSGWCRYDVDDFMQCSSLDDCQYPYPVCKPGTFVCVPNSADPIQVVDFSYSPVGVNDGGIQVKGAFYAASYPLASPAVDNASGGKLISPYTAFLTPPYQFADQANFHARQIVSFSRYTAFCVMSFAVAAPFPGNPPQTAYYTTIFEDPNPMLVMSSIVAAGDPSQSFLFFSFWTQNYLIPNLATPLYNLVGSVSFPSADARIWNPAAVRMIKPDLTSPVEFISNPIVTPWIGITPAGFLPDNQWAMTHSLFFAGGVYRIGFLLSNIGFNTNGQQFTSIHIPSVQDASNVTVPLTPDILLITSWDAMSTWIVNADTVYTTILLYGFLPASGDYRLFVTQIRFQVILPGILRPVVTSGIIDGTTMIPVVSASVQKDFRTPASHCRLSRTLGQVAEPLLLLTVFYEVGAGLQYTTYAINSIDADFNLSDNVPCSGDFTFPGVGSLIYVSSLTGAYNYGSFVVWCRTSQTRSAFMVIQIGATCNMQIPTNPSFSSHPIYSMVYWRRLTGDPLPEPYFLYPIGGASVPYFLATDQPLAFDGTPNLPP